MLFGSLVESCLIAFIFVFFSSLKNCFLATSTTPRHLAYLSSSLASFNRNLDSFSISSQSIEKVSVSSIAFRQLLDPLSFFLAVDTFGHLLNSCICRPFLKLDTSNCRELLTFYIFVQRDSELILLYLSRSLQTLHLPKPLFLTPDFILKNFLA